VNSSFIKGCLGSVAGILVLFTGCAYLFGSSYNKVVKEGSGEAPLEDTSWVPAGYKAFNNNIAWKWSADGSYSCPYARCAQIEVVSKNGCSSLYAEASEIDGSNNNVGFTNATTSSLQPNQKAILMFQSFKDNATSYRLSKISCF
jgi:hypothetical protein